MEEKKDKIEVQLIDLDCQDFKKIIKDREENNRRIEILAGEIKRSERLIKQLLELDDKLTERIEERREKMIERYNLAEDYEWDINLDSYIAIGKEKKK